MAEKVSFARTPRGEYVTVSDGKTTFPDGAVMSRLPADAPPAEGRKAISFARRPGGDLVTVSADGKTVTFPDNVVITRP